MSAACWSPAMPAMGMAAPNSAASVAAVQRAAVAHFGQQRAGHAEQPQQLLVPALRAYIEQQRARGVGHVGGVHAPARQPPQQEAVDRAEGELAALGALTRARMGVEHPGHLGGGEVRIEQQPGLGAHHRLDSLRPASCAHSRAVRRSCQTMARCRGMTAGALPDDRRLALVGDAERGDVREPAGARGDDLAQRGERIAPDVFRVVLDPARRGVVLGRARAVRSAPRGRRRRRRWPASMWCPGRRRVRSGPGSWVHRFTSLQQTRAKLPARWVPSASDAFAPQDAPKGASGASGLSRRRQRAARVPFGELPDPFFRWGYSISRLSAPGKV